VKVTHRIKEIAESFTEKALFSFDKKYWLF